MNIALLIPSSQRFFEKVLNKNNSVIFQEAQFLYRFLIPAVFFTILEAVFQAFGIGFILALLQGMLEPNADPVKTGISWFDLKILGINNPTNERLYPIFTLIVLTVLLRLVFTFLGKLYSLNFQFALAYRLRLRCFEQLEALTLNYFTKNHSGDLVHTITSEINSLTISFATIAELFALTCTALAYTFSMIFLSWQLALISVMLLILQIMGVTMLVRKVREASFERSKASSQYTSRILEFINGIQTVHAFSAYIFEKKRHFQANLDLYQSSTKAKKLIASIAPLSEGLSTILFMGMLALAVAFLIPNGYLRLTSLITFLFILFRLLPIIRQINNHRANIGDLYGSLEKINQLLRKDNKSYFLNGNTQFLTLKRTIELIEVDFNYDGYHQILRKITLTIKKGEMVAIVGASGSGKSTIASLLSRFYDPTRGKILIDGINLKNLDISSFRKKVAFISQETFIFNGSVRDNIAYALEGINETTILEAARLANALDFILELPEGFNTQLGEDGVRLSGGQRQRIAIARALLRNPEILILDEATSALDSGSERLIQRSIERLFVGRTVIAIAHRLSTITKADQVVVIDQGRIVEQGKYIELLQLKGTLWRYHQLQNSDNVKFDDRQTVAKKFDVKPI